MQISLMGRSLAVRHINPKLLSELSKEEDCLGYFDGKTIFINDSLEDEDRRRVLVHEITHAVFSISGITNILDDKHEEAICDALESYLEIFRNKEVMEFLK